MSRSALAVALLLAAGSAAAQHTLEMMQDNGPAENRLDLVLLTDGYTADQQAALCQHTEAVVDRLFENPPYSEYAPFANIARIATVSPEPGADHPSEDTYADTFFDCAYDCMGVERLICCDTETAMSVASELYPGWEVLLMVVNDLQYGGSGGILAVTSSSPISHDIPPHELGHTLAGLADEYEDPYPGFECADFYPNVSSVPGPQDLPWIHWVEGSTPLPTPDSAEIGDLEPVGAFEGACYHATGYYRPVPSCLMRSLDSALCPACSEAMVLAFYGYVEPIDFFSPGDPLVEGAAGEEVELEVETVQPVPDTVTVSWSLDGEPLSGWDGEELLSIPFECLAAGEHDVTAIAVDETELVREDPDQLLSQRVSWALVRTDDGPIEDCFGPSGDAGPDDTDSLEQDGSLHDLYPGSGGCGCSAARPQGFPLARLTILF
ncbi:MAG: M64 family metallopeptidase [Polyangia bacterium]